ncbi:hypothetical protein [Rhizobium sp. RU35A]|uniref:hypothetical protein n=1 Tax=Rhizobium sp. RU35A TaxID=1907414 RepID=UPI00165F7D95|nr:hypothetical protein [Rhizobium sp. RU35A]
MPEKLPAVHLLRVSGKQRLERSEIFHVPFPKDMIEISIVDLRMPRALFTLSVIRQSFAVGSFRAEKRHGMVWPFGPMGENSREKATF